MKIGIITYWESNDNYGQQLQCWALQHYLREKGHDAFLIRQYVWPPMQKKGLRRVKQLIKEWLANLTDRDIQLRQFPKFRGKYLRMSKIFNPPRQLRNNPPSADVYIAGSDQIWNYCMPEDSLRNYFLQFGDKSAKRISYAPSIAQNVLTEEIKPVIKEYLKTFSAISARETSAVKLLQELGYDVTHVLDPSMLLTTEDYLQLAKNVTSKSNVFIYSMNYASADDLPFEQIRTFAEKKGLPIIVTPGSGYLPAQELFDGVEYSYATIPQWIQHIANSELVVTASFHGIVFAILFHRPFIYTPLLGTSAVSNNRVLDLLSELELNERVWQDETTSFDELVSRNIDWNRIDAKLNELRQTSYQYLDKALE